MPSLLNCIRARVGSEPRFVAGTGWRRGQGLRNGGWCSGAGSRAPRLVRRGRRGDQDVLGRYLANRSGSLVLVAGFCC